MGHTSEIGQGTTVHAAGGGYGPPPGGYGPPGGGYGPPGGAPGAPGGYGQPPPPQMGGYGPPPGGAPMGGPAGGNAELKKQAQTWLIISLVSVFFCGNGCFGWIAAILAFLGMQAADQGNVADATGKVKWAKILTIVGVVLGVLGIIAYVIFFVVLGAASAMSN